jgi:hypothetical protein
MGQCHVSPAQGRVLEDLCAGPLESGPVLQLLHSSDNENVQKGHVVCCGTPDGECTSTRRSANAYIDKPCSTKIKASDLVSKELVWFACRAT